MEPFPQAGVLVKPRTRQLAPKKCKTVLWLASCGKCDYNKYHRHFSPRCYNLCRTGIILPQVPQLKKMPTGKLYRHFSIYFGACHLKLSFTEEKELPTLSYQEPRIKHVAMLSFSQMRLSLLRSTWGHLQNTRAPLPSPSCCWEHPFVD